MEIQTYKHNPYGRIQRGPRGDGGVVFGCDVAADGSVSATDVADGLGVEFGFDPGLTNNENRASVWWKDEDTRNVDCGAVGGAKDLFLAGKKTQQELRDWRVIGI